MNISANNEDFTIEETEAVLDGLIASGDVEQFTDDNGGVYYRLTIQGEALSSIVAGNTTAKG